MEIGLLVFGMTRLVKDLFYQEGPLHPLVVRGRFGIHKATSTYDSEPSGCRLEALRGSGQAGATKSENLGSPDELLHQEEPLHPLAVLHLTGIDIAFRIDGNHVQAEELASVLAGAAHFA